MSEISQLRTLPVSERIQIVEDLWDTIAEDSDSLQLSDAQRDELDRRLDRLDRAPHDGAEWTTLKARIQSAL
jgi:putative addiction module component (TIGR02574 family)